MERRKRIHSPRENDKSGPYPTARRVDRLVIKYGLESVEALDVLGIVDTQGIGEGEAVARYKLFQTDFSLFGSPVTHNIGGADPTSMYHRGGGKDEDYADLSVTDRPDDDLPLEPDEVRSEKWLLHNLFRNQFSNRARA